MNNQVNITTKGIKTRYRGIAASGDLNKFIENVARDLAELYSFNAGLLVKSKQIEDTIGGQLDSLQGMVESLSFSGVTNPFTAPVDTVTSHAQSGSSFAIIQLPPDYQTIEGIDECRFSLLHALANLGSTVNVGGIDYADLAVTPLFKAAPFQVEYWDVANGWVVMTDAGTLPTNLTTFHYEQAEDRFLFHEDHATNETLIRVSLQNDLYLGRVESYQQVATGNDSATPVFLYFFDRSKNIIATGYNLVLHNGSEQFLGYMTVVPQGGNVSLNSPSEQVIVDFHTSSGVWTATSGRLGPVTHNAMYRLLTNSANCHHDPTYGQITLPYKSERDKALMRGTDKVLVPDSLKVSTRIFRIHGETLQDTNGNEYRYYDPFRSGNPFNLSKILEDAVLARQDASVVSPELSSADIQTVFEQTDPLFAMDGDPTTPAWYLVPVTDLNGPVLRPFDNDVQTSHVLVLYDIELPQDINSNMFMNTIQIHPLPLFRMHLVDVRYSTGEPFGLDGMGRQFRMDAGVGGTYSPDTPVPYSPKFGPYNLSTTGGDPDTILGVGPNIFWNAGMLELHVKRTELNFLRLVFVADYTPEIATGRNVMMGAMHIGVYHREYKPTGSFQIEFDPATAAVMEEIRDKTSSWVNNKYALFNPDPATEPRFADVVDKGDGRIEVVFGVRTDDMTGTIKRFDNSATPSFKKIVVE